MGTKRRPMGPWIDRQLINAQISAMRHLLDEMRKPMRASAVLSRLTVQEDRRRAIAFEIARLYGEHAIVTMSRTVNIAPPVFGMRWTASVRRPDHLTSLEAIGSTQLRALQILLSTVRSVQPF